MLNIPLDANTLFPEHQRFMVPYYHGSDAFDLFAGRGWTLISWQ